MPITNEGCQCFTVWFWQIMPEKRQKRAPPLQADDHLQTFQRKGFYLMFESPLSQLSAVAQACVLAGMPPPGLRVEHLRFFAVPVNQSKKLQNSDYCTNPDCTLLAHSILWQSSPWAQFGDCVAERPPLQTDSWYALHFAKYKNCMKLRNRRLKLKEIRQIPSSGKGSCQLKTAL